MSGEGKMGGAVFCENSRTCRIPVMISRSNKGAISVRLREQQRPELDGV